MPPLRKKRKADRYCMDTSDSLSSSDFDCSTMRKRKGSQVLTSSSSETESSSQIIMPMSERQQLALIRKLTVDTSIRNSAKPINANRTKSNRRVTKLNEKGETRLHIAARLNKTFAAAELIRDGADVNARDFAGWTPLHEACCHRSIDVAEQLLSAGAMVNVFGPDNETPLHDAARSGSENIVALLLQYGANPHLRNDMHQSAADVAATDVVNRIIAHHHYDASIDIEDCDVAIAKFSPITSPCCTSKPFYSEKWQKLGSQTSSQCGHITLSRREEGSGDCATFPLMSAGSKLKSTDERQIHRNHSRVNLSRLSSTMKSKVSWLSSASVQTSQTYSLTSVPTRRIDDFNSLPRSLSNQQKSRVSFSNTTAGHCCNVLNSTESQNQLLTNSTAEAQSGKASTSFGESDVFYHRSQCMPASLVVGSPEFVDKAVGAKFDRTADSKEQPEMKVFRGLFELFGFDKMFPSGSSDTRNGKSLSGIAITGASTDLSMKPSTSSAGSQSSILAQTAINKTMKADCQLPNVSSSTAGTKVSCDSVSHVANVELDKLRSHPIVDHHHLAPLSALPCRTDNDKNYSHSRECPPDLTVGILSSLNGAPAVSNGTRQQKDSFSGVDAFEETVKSRLANDNNCSLSDDIKERRLAKGKITISQSADHSEKSDFPTFLKGKDFAQSSSANSDMSPEVDSSSSQPYRPLKLVLMKCGDGNTEQPLWLAMSFMDTKTSENLRTSKEQRKALKSSSETVVANVQRRFKISDNSVTADGTVAASSVHLPITAVRRASCSSQREQPSDKLKQLSRTRCQDLVNSSVNYNTNDGSAAKCGRDQCRMPPSSSFDTDQPVIARSKHEILLPDDIDDYLLVTKHYPLHSDGNKVENMVPPPAGLPAPLRELFVVQERERNILHQSFLKQAVQLMLTVELEILREYSRASPTGHFQHSFCAGAFCPTDGFSSCSKSLHSLPREANQQLISQLSRLCDKFNKIQSQQMMRWRHEADCLHAIQVQHWSWKLQELRSDADDADLSHSIYVPLVKTNCLAGQFDQLPRSVFLQS